MQVCRDVSMSHERSLAEYSLTLLRGCGEDVSAA